MDDAQVGWIAAIIFGGAAGRLVRGPPGEFEAGVEVSIGAPRPAARTTGRDDLNHAEGSLAPAIDLAENNSEPQSVDAAFSSARLK